MKKSNLYYQYYSEIYHKKDYQKETALILSQATRYGISNPQKILEIGCGTGNFTFLIGRKTPNLLAIDIDPKMIKIANQKLAQINLPSIRFLLSPVEKLKERRFDLALALFNIVNYLPDESALKIFMEATYNCLAPNGLFIFDSWNGIAAILDPPKQKIVTAKRGQEKIKYVLIPETDFLKQNVVLNYNIEVVKGNKKIKKGVHSFNQTLWMPQQIKTAILGAGFKIASIFPLMKPDRTITETDWKIMFICKKC